MSEPLETGGRGSAAGTSASASTDTRPVRPSEQLDWRALELFAREKLAAACGSSFDRDAPMAVEQFPGGHSNLTYLLRFGAQEFVLRRPPFGPVPPRAHDMARECRLLAAINPVFPLAPRPFALCEDTGIIGSTFYLMERRRGIIVRGEEPSLLRDNAEARRLLSRNMIDTLAELHRVDVSSPELAALGRPVGFVERQVRGWSERWRGSQTTELPEMDALARWLAERLPPEQARASLVHGDYKLDNVMLDTGEITRLVAVFDWEMCALGDPLVDLGILLCYWIHVATISQSDSLRFITHGEGWYTRDEMIERYARQTGFDLSNITFYEVFAVFKLAVVLQQIFYRYYRGQTDDPRFASLDERVKWLARTGISLIEKFGS